MKILSIKLKTAIIKFFKRYKGRPLVLPIAFAFVVFAALFAVFSLATPFLFHVTVTFDSDYGSPVDTLVLRIGGTIDDMPLTERSYNTFTGWYLDENKSIPYAGEKFDKDATLYAGWQTHFTRDFYQSSLDKLNAIYQLRFDLDSCAVFGRDAIKERLNGDLLYDYADYLEILMTAESEEVGSPTIYSLLADTPDRANEIYETRVKTDEILTQFFTVVKDRALFLCTYGLETLIFETVEENDEYFFTRSQDEIMLLRYKGNATSLQMPSYIDNVPVTGIGYFCYAQKNIIDFTFNEYIESIGGAAFANMEKLKSINIPSKVKVLPESLFHNSSLLENIEFDSSSQLETIGLNAFSYCTSLKKISIPPKVSFIDYYAFYDSGMEEIQFDEDSQLLEIKDNAFGNCRNLQSIVLPEGLMKLSGEAFINCPILKNVVFPSTLTYIGNRSFADCLLLENVFLPQNLKYLGEGAFSNCLSFTQFTIYENIDYVGENVLSGCQGLIEISVPLNAGGGTYANDIMRYLLGWMNLENLKKITINNNITVLKAEAFANMTQIETVILPDTIVRIEKNVFSGCSSLIDIELPEGLEYIGDSAFEKCNALIRLNLPSRLKEIGNYAFYGENMQISDFGITTEDALEIIGDYAFAENAYLASFPFPAGLKKIGSYAFRNCISLPSADYPIDCEIGYGAFQNCASLREMTIRLSSFGKYPSYPGHYFGNQPYEGYLIPQALQKVIIYNGCDVIPAGAFHSWSSLETVVIPDTVRTIGKEAFFACGSLNKIDFPDGLEEIKENAFQGCTNLTQVILPGSVKRLGSQAFFYCQNLTKVYFPASLEEIGVSVLMGCMSIEDFTAPLSDGPYDRTSNTYINYYFNESGYASQNDFIKKITVLPNGINRIGEGAFANLFAVTDIVLPDTVETIDKMAFAGDINLSSFSFPSQLKTIGESAFLWCSSLREAVFPDSVYYVGNNAFSGCSAMTRAVFSSASKISSVGAAAFINCGELTDVSFPDYSLYEIDYSMFENCISLKNFRFPANLQYIRDSAFTNTGLESVRIPFTVGEIGIYSFKNCASLTGVMFEKSDNDRQLINSIGREAFAGCTGLTEIDLPKSVKEIVGDSFNGCTNLKKVIVRKEYNYKSPTWQTLATWANSGGNFDNCHPDLLIYVPKNNAGITEDYWVNGEYHPEARNGVSMYKTLPNWEAYAAIIVAIPDGW